MRKVLAWVAGVIGWVLFIQLVILFFILMYSFLGNLYGVGYVAFIAYWVSPFIALKVYCVVAKESKENPTISMILFILFMVLFLAVEVGRSGTLTRGKESGIALGVVSILGEMIRLIKVRRNVKKAELEDKNKDELEG